MKNKWISLDPPNYIISGYKHVKNHDKCMFDKMLLY